MVQDGRAVTLQVEVAVVRRVDDAAAVAVHRVADAQPALLQQVGDGDAYVAGETSLHMPMDRVEHERVVRLEDDVPVLLTQVRAAAVEVVLSVVHIKLVLHAVEHEARLGDAVGIGCDDLAFV